MNDLFINNKNIFIEGDKSSFNSKSSLNKFKDLIKLNWDVDIIKLSKKYINPEFNVEIKSKSDTELHIIIKNNNNIPSNINQDNLLLNKIRDKIKYIKNKRTNNNLLIKNNNNIPSHIIKQYNDLKKNDKHSIINKLPNLNEIFNNPNKYMQIISDIITNFSTFANANKNPYYKYLISILNELKKNKNHDTDTDSNDDTNNNHDNINNDNILDNIMKAAKINISCDTEDDNDTEDEDIKDDNDTEDEDIKDHEYIKDTEDIKD